MFVVNKSGVYNYLIDWLYSFAHKNDQNLTLTSQPHDTFFGFDQQEVNIGTFNICNLHLYRSIHFSR